MSGIRTPLARVRGLGSAKEGVQHWWAQRLTALALVPLSLWFIASMVALTGASYDTITAWMIWQWDTRILEPGKTPRPKADFHQSTFLGMPLAPAMFEQMSQSYLPELNQAGLIERFILERMDGHNSLQEIAQQVAARFSGRFARASEALGRVQELARKYSH